MKKLVLVFAVIVLCAGCATVEEVSVSTVKVAEADNSPKRTTRKSLEEQSMLGEEAGSLWVGRGQASYLFTNNNQRLLGDIVTVNIEGYPKEQIQTKANVISKLLAEILNEQRQEIKLKQEELKKQLIPDPNKVEEEEQHFLMRGLASVTGIGARPEKDPNAPPPVDPNVLISQNEKRLKKISEEEDEIKNLKSGNEFPIRSVVSRVVEIQKDGNYKIRGEQAFMIGKRDYKLLVMGTVRAEEWQEKGISAEILIDPVFDIISENKSGDL